MEFPKFFKQPKGNTRREQPSEKSTSKRPQEELSEEGFSRRDVLKIAAETAAVAATEKIFEKPVLNSLFKKITSSETNTESANLKELRTSLQQENAENKKTRHEMETEDNGVIGKTFLEQLERSRYITLGKPTRNAVSKHWEEAYAPGTVNYRKGLVDGLARMQPWAAKIKKIFQNYGVPEKFSYLAIAESHFRIGDVSTVGAVGPYQITQSTTELPIFAPLALKVTAKYDDRLDPLKSAELCAAHLSSSFKRFGGGNGDARKDEEAWTFALLAYNGNFVNDFLKNLNRTELTMPEKEISTQEKYSIKQGERLEQIAERFGTSLQLLYKMNAEPKISFEKWKKETVKPGMSLRIPQTRKNGLEDFYTYLEGRINTQIQEELASDEYLIEKGDTPASIAKKFGFDMKFLEALNPRLNHNSLRAGQTLHVPKNFKKNPNYLLEIVSGFKENINYPGKFEAICKIIKSHNLGKNMENAQHSFLTVKLDRKTSLFGFSREKKISLADLEKLNPAIKDAYHLTLPRSTEIRVPNPYLTAEKNTPPKNRS